MSPNWRASRGQARKRCLPLLEKKKTRSFFCSLFDLEQIMNIILEDLLAFIP
jgi:hypothetical protein